MTTVLDVLAAAPPVDYFVVFPLAVGALYGLVAAVAVMPLEIPTRAAGAAVPSLWAAAVSVIAHPVLIATAAYLDAELLTPEAFLVFVQICGAILGLLAGMAVSFFRWTVRVSRTRAPRYSVPETDQVLIVR